MKCEVVLIKTIKWKITQYNHDKAEKAKKDLSMEKFDIYTKSTAKKYVLVDLWE